MQAVIEYRDSAAGIGARNLEAPFFVGWPSRPDTETHLRLLAESDLVSLALETDTEQVVGFATASTDGVLSAFIAFLEVTPERQGEGIGSELVRRLLAQLQPIYAVDVVCDADLQPFYERPGFARAATALSLRNYNVQHGR